MKIKNDWIISIVVILLLFLVFVITLVDICLSRTTGFTTSKLIGFDLRFLKAGMLVLAEGFIIWRFIIYNKKEGR